MNQVLFETLLGSLGEAQEDRKQPENLKPSTVKRVKDRGLAYSDRYRGQWHRPEYDFDELQIAQDTDGYMTRAVLKKTNRIICAGYSFVGKNKEAVAYIERRTREIAWVTQRPFPLTIWGTFYDLFRFTNCMWVKVRDRQRSSGRLRKDFGTEVDPVAGYFLLPFETLEFSTKANGEIKKLLQRLPGGRTREFVPRDIVHFHAYKKPGFVVGTPELYPALDDIALLRRMEENVEELVESNLFPVFHYKVGNDAYPERYAPDGKKESDVVKQTIEYMPSGGIYVSDHRHEITTVGSEGKALRVDFYLTYFKNRALASLGTSTIDMGEGGTANRSTASTLSKGMLLDVEAMTKIVKEFINFFVIGELLLEGGFDPLGNPDHRVEIRFGIIDTEERRANENQQIQLFHGNLQTMEETRQALGHEPWTDDHYERAHYSMFEEPLALIKAIDPVAAASVLSKHHASSMTPEVAHKTEQLARQAARPEGRPSSSSKSKSASSSSQNKARPANQHGIRSSAKTTKDVSITAPDGSVTMLACDVDVDPGRLEEWTELVLKRYSQVQDVSLETLAQNMAWRLNR